MLRVDQRSDGEIVKKARQGENFLSRTTLTPETCQQLGKHPGRGKLERSRCKIWGERIFSHDVAAVLAVQVHALSWFPDCCRPALALSRSQPARTTAMQVSEGL